MKDVEAEVDTEPGDHHRPMIIVIPRGR